MTITAPNRSDTPTQFEPGAWTARHVAAQLEAGIPPRVVRQMIHGWPQPSTYATEHASRRENAWPRPLPPLATIPPEHWLALQGDLEYPIALEDLTHPPLLLYGRGNKHILATKGLALFGGDHLSRFGEGVVAGAVRVSEIPYLVLLEGAVAPAAVAVATELGAPIIGVVATGPDMLNPEQEKLASIILGNGGAIVSEQPFGTSDTNAPNRTPAPYADRLSAATRLMAALAFAAVFVEGDGRCTGMRGIWHTMHLGRPVFVAKPRTAAPQSQLQGPVALAASQRRSEETLLAMGASASLAARHRNSTEPLAAGIARDRDELELLVKAAHLLQPGTEFL